MLEEIPNFPQAFMDRHMNWHMAMPPDGRTIPKGDPGSGAQFLDFHHQFIVDVKAWYATQPGANMTKVAAWSHFPSDLAAAHSPELADYQAYASTASNFTSEDALGIYVEHEHDYVHGYIASLYATPGFGSLDSCKYFMFYQWHGMIDLWRGNWLVHHKSAVKDVVDHHGKLFRDIGTKPLRDVPKLAHEVPPKSPKELVEVIGRPDEGDPFAALESRLSKLEAVVHRQSFIRKKERPNIG